VDGFEARRVPIQVELAQIVGWVRFGKGQIAEESLAEGHVRGGPASLTNHGSQPLRPLGPAISAPPASRKDALALARHVAVNLLERADLACGEAAGLVARVALRKIARGLEAAAARVVDQAVLQPILGIALRVDLLG